MRTQVTLAVVAVIGLSFAMAQTARAEALYGLTNLQQLVTFDSATRTVTSTRSLPFSITGEILVSIDVRPATGQLYAFSNQNNLYVITPVDATTASASQVGVTVPGVTGNIKSIDFNPTVDRIRLVTTSNQNFRLHPVTGAIAFTDMSLAFKNGDANEGDTAAVVSAAYTNSFAGAATTTLYDIEAGNNILATQAPPNDGLLNTVGLIGGDIASSGGFTGFDISGASGIAYLTANNLAGGLTPNALYTVNLASGAATLAGPVSGINGTFRDIAVIGVPEPSTLLIALAGIVAMVATRRRTLPPNA